MAWEHTIISGKTNREKKLPQQQCDINHLFTLERIFYQSKKMKSLNEVKGGELPRFFPPPADVQPIVETDNELDQI